MAAFEWPIDKLTLINSALSQTGDNLVAVSDDGSDEWLTCSPAYERALAAVTESHPWAWVTDMRPLQPAGNKPADDQFDTACNLPADLVHLIYVRVSDRPCVWDLMGDQLVVNANGSPITIRGIFSTNSDPTFGTPTVVLALQHFVMSGIYRGLHEDAAEAQKMFSLATGMLETAKSRHDMQKPKRSMFNSRITASRRIRRPWPPVPGGWGGTGSPG